MTRDGRLVIDDPEVRRRAHPGDRRLHGHLPQGLHPARFADLGQLRQQRAVPGADHRDDGEPDALDPERAQGERPEDYYENPPRSTGRSAPMASRSSSRPSSIAPWSSRTAARRDRQGVRALPGRRGLARALSRLLRRAHAAADAEAARCAVLARPERPAPHGSAMQFLTQPRSYNYAAVSGDWRHDRADERVWAEAVHRVAAEGISPEQAVDEAIARIKQILSGVTEHRWAFPRRDIDVHEHSRPRRCARHGAARRRGRRPRGLVGEGRYPEEDEAVREIVAAFEQETGKQVELVLPFRGRELAGQIEAALEAGQPPDFAFGIAAQLRRGMGLRGSARGPHRRCSATSRTCSIRTRSRGGRCSTRRPGRRPLRAADGADRPTTSTSGRASWSGRGSPSPTSRSEWERSGPSGAIRCSRPCARPLGRDDIWGVGLSMSADSATRRTGSTSSCCLRGGLRDPRRPARHRRPGGPAPAHQGDRQLHGHLPQGLHPARFGDVGRQRQQQGVPRPERWS